MIELSELEVLLLEHVLCVLLARVLHAVGDLHDTSSLEGRNAETSMQIKEGSSLLQELACEHF